jgi:hypothetical protein
MTNNEMFEKLKAQDMTICVNPVSEDLLAVFEAKRVGIKTIVLVPADKYKVVESEGIIMLVEKEHQKS